jgi:hypothetical protein
LALQAKEGFRLQHASTASLLPCWDYVDFGFTADCGLCLPAGQAGTANLFYAFFLLLKIFSHNTFNGSKYLSATRSFKGMIPLSVM